MQPFDPANSGPRSNSVQWKVVLGLVVMVGVVAAVWAMFYVTRDVQLVPPRLIGSVWTASVDGATRVYFVTKEDRAVTRSFDPDGQYTYQHTYSLYTLFSRNASDGSTAAETLIARIETTSPDFKKYRAYVTLPDGPGVLGPQADVLWLWNGGLEARSLKTLEPVWTDQQLRAKNATVAANMPDDPKYAKVLSGLDALVFKSRDARYLRVNRESGAFEPVNEPEMAALSREHTKTADMAFTSVPPPGESLRSTSASGLIWNSLLDHGKWYALLSSDERAALLPRLGWLEEWQFRHAAIRESASQLFGGMYETEPQPSLQRTIMQLKLDSVTPLGDERFIMAGFLRRPESQDAWVLPAREWTAETGAVGKAPTVASFIVLEREAIGDKGAWQLRRVGVDGRRPGSARRG